MRVCYTTMLSTSYQSEYINHSINLISPHLEHLCEQVHDGRAEVAGNVELSALDLLKEHCDVVVIKWERPTEQGILNDPT